MSETLLPRYRETIPVLMDAVPEAKGLKRLALFAGAIIVVHMQRKEIIEEHDFPMINPITQPAGSYDLRDPITGAEPQTMETLMIEIEKLRNESTTNCNSSK